MNRNAIFHPTATWDSDRSGYNVASLGNRVPKFRDYIISCSPWTYRGADKSLARPGRKQANVSVRMAWISFGALPCKKINLMTDRVSMLLKSRASLTCFRTCFLPGRAKDLSAPRIWTAMQYSILLFLGIPFVRDITLHHWPIGSRCFETTLFPVLLGYVDPWLWVQLLHFSVLACFCTIELKQANTKMWFF